MPYFPTYARPAAIRSRPTAILCLCVLLLGLAACSGAGPGEPPPPAEEPDTTAPAAPASLEGTSGDGQIALTWSAPGASDLAGYNVYRSTSSFSDKDSAKLLNGNAPVEESAYTDTGAQNGTTYYYRVTAVDESGNESRLSNEIKKTPFPDPPDEP